MVNETLIDPGCRTAYRNRPTGLPGQVPEQDMMMGGLLRLLGVPIPVLILIWFFSLRDR